MKASLSYPLLFLALLAAVPQQAGASEIPGRSRLAETDPGSLMLEDILPKPVKLSVAADSFIYYQRDMQRVLGSMSAGTVVQLVAMSETGHYKVRGKARHGDVAGWMRMVDLKSADPKLAENLKKFAERRKQIDEIIKNKQVAIGMTSSEVKASLGEPQRKSTRITAEGREETMEYVTYKSVPQYVTGRDQFGNLVQNVVYVKVESGKLNLVFKNSAVETIEEIQGNPLGGGGVKIVPAPIILN